MQPGRQLTELKLPPLRDPRQPRLLLLVMPSAAADVAAAAAVGAAAVAPSDRAAAALHGAAAVPAAAAAGPADPFPTYQLSTLSSEYPAGHRATDAAVSCVIHP